MPLLPIGKFWRLDAEGFIENDAAPEKIAPPYDGLVKEARGAFREHLGDSLHSVYIRGTVARGAAIGNVSDLDGFALVEVDPNSLDLSWRGDEEARLLSRHPYVIGASLDVVCVDDLGDGEHFSELGLEMATQSVCVHGENLIPSLPKYRPGILTANNDLCQIGADIREGLAELEEDPSPENILYWSRRVSKNMFRAGFSLTVLENRRFTRDLYPCYRSFAEFYPGREPEMRHAAGYVLEPSDDAEQTSAFLEDFEAWISSEAELWLERHNPSRELELGLEEYPEEVRFSPA